VSDEANTVRFEGEPVYLCPRCLCRDGTLMVLEAATAVCPRCGLHYSIVTTEAPLTIVEVDRERGSITVSGSPAPGRRSGVRERHLSAPDRQRRRLP